ncbi:MAG: aldo/keto reductase [Carnobacterium sp.]|uniref:aldo/keto reductase n=1 Tax=Carnobacterium sp. TaxID=48221 RepID=UPI0033164796
MVVSLLDRMALNNGYTIPGIGLGTSGMTGQEAEDAVFSAIMKGYRLIDTASQYDNEEDVGRGINRAVSSGVSRDEIFLVTKIWKTDAGFDNAIQSFEASLSRLNQPYVDLLLIHWPDKDDAVNIDTWRALEDIYESGRARSIGVSNFSRGDLAELLKEAKVRPAINQFEVYPGNPNQDLNDYCDSENIVTMAYSPLKRGNVSKERHLTTIGEKYGKTPSQVALRWDIQRDVIPIPKSSNKDRMQENIEVFDFMLSDEDMNTINNLDKQNRDRNPNGMVRSGDVKGRTSRENRQGRR